MQIPETLLSYIEGELSRLQYGKVTIEINEASKKIDVSTEVKQRFYTKKDEQNEQRY